MMRLGDYKPESLPFMTDELLSAVLNSQPDRQVWADAFELDTLAEDLSIRTPERVEIPNNSEFDGRLLEINLFDDGGFPRLTGKLKVMDGEAKGQYLYCSISSLSETSRVRMMGFLNDFIPGVIDSISMEALQEAIDKVKAVYKRKIIPYRYLSRSDGFRPISIIEP